MFQFPAGVIDFSLSRNVKTDFGAHTNSCSVVIGDFFLGDKTAGRVADRVSHLVRR